MNNRVKRWIDSVERERNRLIDAGHNIPETSWEIVTEADKTLAIYLNDRGFLLTDAARSNICRTVAAAARLERTFAKTKSRAKEEAYARRKKGKTAYITNELYKLHEALNIQIPTNNEINKALCEVAQKRVTAHNECAERCDEAPPPYSQAEELAHRIAICNSFRNLKDAISIAIHNFEEAPIDIRSDHTQLSHIPELATLYRNTLLAENPTATFTESPSADLFTFVSQFLSIIYPEWEDVERGLRLALRNYIHDPASKTTPESGGTGRNTN